MTTWKTIARTGAVIAAIATMSACASVETYNVAETVAQDPTIPHVVINGVTYHAETFGDPADPVVITLHGGPGGDYRTILSLRDLSDQYFVVFFDQRGSGLSPRVDPAEITLESAIGDLDSIVDYYGKGQKVDLVGHSWGAMLAAAYIGRHPDKVEHAVLAEPGFLTAEFAEEWAELTRLRISFPLLRHLVQTKSAARRVDGPDEYAKDDYFSYQMNMYQGEDHPQAGYRCDGGGPQPGEFWRFGAAAQEALFQEAVDSRGNFTIDLTVGLDNFTNTVLFVAGECQQIIGAEWQARQMRFFPSAELVVISGAGHEMFLENRHESIRVVRAYLNAPVR